MFGVYMAIAIERYRAEIERYRATSAQAQMTEMYNQSNAFQVNQCMQSKRVNCFYCGCQVASGRHCNSCGAPDRTKP